MTIGNRPDTAARALARFAIALGIVAFFYGIAVQLGYNPLPTASNQQPPPHAPDHAQPPKHTEQPR